MRIFFRIIPLCMLLFGFVACGDNEEVKVETLEVTPANLNGTWQLVEWNGQPITEGIVIYLLCEKIKLLRCTRSLIVCMLVSLAAHLR